MKTCVTSGSVEGIDGQLHHFIILIIIELMLLMTSFLATDENADTIPIFT